MERHENESYLDYVKRVTSALECDTIGYKEWGDYILGADNNYSSDNLRKGFYIVRKMLPKLDGSAEVTDEDIIRQIQTQKDELYKERVKLQDQRREYNKNLRVEARYENLRDTLVECVEGMIPLIDYKENGGRLVDKPMLKEAVLDISDVHYGIEVDNVLNYYDTNIAKERMEKLLNKTIGYIIDQKIGVLHICVLGDLLSGNIHVSTRIDNEEDIISQTISMSEILSNFINEVSKFCKVKVYGVIGNHSRVNSNKKESLPAENFERLIFEYINLRCPNNKVLLNGLEDWQTFNIGDREIFITHGDKDTLNNVKNHAVNLLGRVPDEIHIGHFHHMNIKDDNNCEIVQNGSVISTDEYAMSRRLHTDPYQVLRIYGDDIQTIKVSLK